MKLSEYKTEDLINEIVERDCLEELFEQVDIDELLIALDLKSAFPRALQLADIRELIKEFENREDLNDYGDYISDLFVQSKLSKLRLTQSDDRNSAKEYINIILKLNGLGDVNDVIDAVKELYKL